MATQVHGIAYNHNQSVDCQLHGTLSEQSSRELVKGMTITRKEYRDLEKELDWLEKEQYSYTQEKVDRINEIYTILVG